MTALVVGSGGREHALAWALARGESVRNVIVTPGNGGTADEPGVENQPVAADDAEAIVALAQDRHVGLAVVGPEGPLAAGLADDLREAGILTFGPSARAAVLEASKSWARGFMHRHQIPHPRFVAADTLEAAEKAVVDFGGRCVVKADGLAAGKGVVVADDADEALRSIEGMLRRHRLGAAGNLVVVEERLDGPEFSVMAIADGTEYRLLLPAQDHKRLLEDDRGPNTGGMGAYAPAPLVSPGLLRRVQSEVIEPTLAGMASEDRRFSGCLYSSLILTEAGPVVIEFNVRFGDPETQVQLPLVRGDLARLLAAAAAGNLAEAQVDLAPNEASVCVVLAAEGYPGDYAKGRPILGLDGAAAVPGLKVFHAGTVREEGELVSSGGRVLGVTCTRESLADAQACAYGAIGETGVHFAGMQYRQDIAARAFA
jgi:phosphoribosylamine--glycine ligase